MKNIKTISAVLALAFLSLSFTSTTKETKKELNDRIVQLIRNSSTQVLANINLDVDITLTLNEKSEIVIISVKSDNEIVDRFIKSRLNYKKVKVKSLNPGETYRLPLKVVTI